jgi:UDP-N-acetylmuramoyl-tripeptide--D-alanyl-D-alanine ligase
LNRDNSHFARLAAAAGDAKVIGFGTTEQADVRLTAFAPKAPGSAVSVALRGRTVSYCVGVPGRHWALNSLAVLAAVDAVGADPIAAALALKDMRAPKGRGARHVVKAEAGTFEVIDESYNASPVSMGAAIKVLGESEGARRIAVLGDMLELGPESGARHRELAGPIETAGLDLVYTCGTDMQLLFDALPRSMRGGHAADAESLVPLVASAVRPGDVVMVKGSAGSRTGLVVDALLGLGTNGNGASKRAAQGR